MIRKHTNLSPPSTAFIRKDKDFHRQLSASKKLNKFWAIRNLSFEVNRGQVIGIIGFNGAGKSTLLKILARITAPTEGRVWMKGRVASLLEVGTGFHPELTGRENIYLNGTLLGMSRREIKKKFDEIVEFAEVERFLDTPVKRFSSGMYVRLAFAIAAHLEPEILLVDEVLAVGDASFQQRCLGKMQDATKEGRTILFVSHNMLTVQSLCPRTILLKSGNIVFYGNTETGVSQYLKQDSITSKSKIDLHKHKGRSKRFKTIFRSIRVCNRELKQTSTIFIGDSVIFEITLETDGDVLHSPVVLIELRDTREIPICKFTSEVMSPDGFQICGRNLLRCFWKACCLVSGIYSINLELRNAGINIDVVKKAVSIHVRASEIHNSRNLHTGPGFIIPEEKWELETLS